MSSLIASIALLLSSGAFAQQPEFEPTWESLNARQAPEWFGDAKFGIFIHWGVYSVPAFCDTSTYSEWYQHWYDTNSHGGLVRKFHDEQYGADFSYRDFAGQFKAEFYDPAEWAEVFRRSGARYVVLTSKHHDGYCLWPNETASEVRGYPWNAAQTAPGRDLLGELDQAVRAAGLRMGLYYSFLEWHNPLFDSDRARYVDEVMIPQIKELITHYQPAVFWPDGEWNHPDSEWRSTEILEWIYENCANPDELVVNDRWGRALRGSVGDYSTTEYGNLGGGAGGLQESKPFEECRGIGHSFAFNRAEGYDVYMGRTECVRLLIDLVSKGGNLLLDIGPTGDGRIPLIMQDRLIAIGRWLDTNGEAIYGTTASPFRPGSWGRATTKGSTLYLHLYDWPSQDAFAVPGLMNRIEKAWLLHDDRKLALPVDASEEGRPVIDLRRHHPFEYASVLALQLDGPPRVEERIVADASGFLELRADAAQIEGNGMRLESSQDKTSGETVSNLGYWTGTNERAVWPSVSLASGQTYTIEVEYACAPGNEGGSLILEFRRGEESLPVALPVVVPTASWTDYTTLPEIHLRAPVDWGPVEVSVRAESIPQGKALMNLRAIRFVPQGGTGGG